MVDDIRLFSRIIASGSLSAAGRELGISAPMVSKRLARLEARLGVALVRRTTRRLDLTAPGARFHQDVLAILAAIEDAEAKLAGDAHEPAGNLRITAPTSFGRLHIAPMLAPFLEAFPRVRVELDLSDRFVDILAERIDLAIRITATIGAGLEAERLATSGRVLCAAPSYIARRGTPKAISDLRDHELLAAEGQLPWHLSGGEGPEMVTGVSRVRTNSSEVVRELAIAGGGIALRSLWDVSEDLTAGRLVRVLADVEGTADTGIFAVRPKAAIATPAVRAFLAHLHALMRPLPPWERA